MAVLNAKEQEILKVLHAGRPLRHDEHLQRLIDSGHVIEKDGIYQLTDQGLAEAKVAQGFGAAIADAFLPGAGSKDFGKKP